MGHTKTGRNKLIPIIAVILAVAAVAGGIAIWYNLPVNKMNRALKAEDYKLASELYPQLTEDNDRHRVEKIFLRECRGYYDEYINEDISYKEAREFYKLASSNVLRGNESLKEIRNITDIVYEDRNAYEDALELLADKEYKEAILLLVSITDYDVKTYEAASAKALAAYDDYTSACMDDIREAIDIKEYETAIAYVDSALAFIPESYQGHSFMDTRLALERIRSNIEQLMNDGAADGVYSTTYDIGNLLAEELGTDADIHIQVTMIVEISDTTLHIYPDTSELEAAIDSFANEHSDIIYELAENYGIDPDMAKTAIDLMYNGSWSAFIMDNFSSEIDAAMAATDRYIYYEIEADKCYTWEEGASKSPDNAATVEFAKKSITITNLTPELTASFGDQEAIILTETEN